MQRLVKSAYRLNVPSSFFIMIIKCLPGEKYFLPGDFIDYPVHGIQIHISVRGCVNAILISYITDLFAGEWFSAYGIPKCAVPFIR